MKKKSFSIRLFMVPTAIILALCFLFSSIDAIAETYIETSVITRNSSPVAENLAFTTYCGIPIEGEFSSLDPDGDPVTYSVTQECKKGTVEYSGSTFTYTPSENKKGKDSFKYAAIDSAGNISNEATVSITIKKQSTSVSYSDLDGSSSAYPAAYLAENGIFIGEKIGDKYLFSPDTVVTRGEFLAMCIELSGIEKINGVSSTGFYDDEEIPLWQKPYVTTGLINNVIKGSVRSDGRIVFSANEPITFSQAAVIINNTLNITNVSYSEYEDVYPAWACQAAANVISCDIIPGASLTVSDAALTRADAAEILLNATKVLEERDESFSILSWAK